MSESLNRLKALIDACSAEEQAALLDYLKERLPVHPLEAQWNVSADVILSAISRSNDLTQRGVRGIIAEAIFDRYVLPEAAGWESVGFSDDSPYDFLIRSDAREVRIQVKLQRRKNQRAMFASEANRHYPDDMYVAEVQKTRGGRDTKTGKNTRPYHFGEFDILAVNMHPSTTDWYQFRFTVGNWLLPRYEDPALIAIYQPVARDPNDLWTDRIETCLEWLAAGKQKRILNIAPELLQPRRRARRTRDP